MKVDKASYPGNPRLRRAFDAVFGGREVRFEKAVESTADPIRHAAEHDCFLVEDGERALFLTVLFDNLTDLVDTTEVAEAATTAHKLGVAPEVVAVAADAGAIAYQPLPAEFHWIRAQEMFNRDVLAGVVAAKRTVHQGPPLRRERDVFTDLDHWYRLATEAGAVLPTDYGWMVEQVRRIAAALRASGRDVRPCHRDGTVSNVMLGPGNEVRLVDFDSAGNGDPHHDIASLLVEFCRLDVEWRRAVEVIEGRCDQRSLARYRLNAIADDLAVGTWGLLLGARSDNVGLDYARYGQWRLLRCRYALHDRRFEAWLRHA